MKDALPSVSIIIPVYNRAKWIKDCLHALMNIDYPKEKLEIIVTDDGSTDKTTEIITEFKNNYFNIKLLSTTRQGSAAARRLAISRASSEIIAFIDSDCKVDKNWIKELIKYFQNEKIGAVAGNTLYYGPRNYVAKILERKSIKITYYYALRKKLEIQYAPTCNLAVRREILKIIGEYGKGFYHGGDDIDLGIKIRNLGYNIALAKKAVVYHPREIRKNLLSTLRTLILYGKADFTLQLKYPHRKKLTFPPPLFVFFYLSLFIIIVISFQPPHYLFFPVIYMFLYTLTDYLLIFLTKSKNLYEYTLGRAANYSLIEYLVGFLLRCAYDLGIFLGKISKFEFTPTYFIVDDRTLFNIKKINKKEIFINLIIFAFLCLLMKK